MLKVYVAPGQCQRLAGDAQSTPTGQGDQQLPLGIGCRVYDLSNILGRNELPLGRVALHRRGDVSKRVCFDQPTPLGHLEKVPGVPDPLVDRRTGTFSSEQMGLVVVGIGRHDLPDVGPSPQEPHQMPSGLFHHHHRRGL
ncbi:MAG: hypothetical protein R3C45_20545 [Phycisphaerales bacterium]